MRRGSTPIHVFSVNRDLREAQVFLTYKQGDDVIVTKTNEDMEISEDGIAVGLTQEDTLKLKASRRVEVQLRYINSDGLAEASDIIKMNVDKILQDGVIEYRN